MTDVMKLGPYDLNQIYTGDARELAKAIPDSSVDLIFTDPVYDRIDDYRWLAETAARVLKPDRACLAFVGVPYLPETHNALRMGGLSYRWRVVFRIIFGSGSGSWRGKIQTGTQELLIYQKGQARMLSSLFDHIQIVRKEYGSEMRRDGTRVWGKPLETGIHPIRAFCNPGDIVADFFTGGGTVPAVAKMLGVNYWACEIDPATAELARKRVEQTQPPLFVMPQPEQTTFEDLL